MLIKCAKHTLQSHFLKSTHYIMNQFFFIASLNSSSTMFDLGLRIFLRHMCSRLDCWHFCSKRFIFNSRWARVEIQREHPIFYCELRPQSCFFDKKLFWRLLFVIPSCWNSLVKHTQYMWALIPLFERKTICSITTLIKGTPIFERNQVTPIWDVLIFENITTTCWYRSWPGPYI